MGKKDYDKLKKKIETSEVDFFNVQIDIIGLKINTLNRMQLLDIIILLNKQMIESTKNWEGG